MWSDKNNRNVVAKLRNELKVKGKASKSLSSKRKMMIGWWGRLNRLNQLN